MADKKPALALIFGKGGGKSAPTDDGEGEDGPNEEYLTAYKEYEADPSAETLWRAIKACVDGGGY